MSAAALPHLVPAGRLERSPGPAQWTIAETAGRLVELSALGAAAGLTLAFSLVLDAQRRREPVAWVTPPEHVFYPPDAAEGGVDLDALVVVRPPTARLVARAADHLLRSGAFGLIVLDLGASSEIPIPLQTRLSGLAQKHHTALVCLTEKAETLPSLGSLVSLRAHARRARIAGDRFACDLAVRKDKRRGPTWTHAEVCRGPAGLC